jgi:hypothetical protein
MPQHIGRLRAYTTGEPYKPDNTTLYDAWPFDDEFSVDLFVLRRLPDFNYDGTESIMFMALICHQFGNG